MSLIIKHNPGLHDRLRNFTVDNHAEELLTYLNELSNKDFRTASFFLGDDLLVELSPESYWHFFAVLVSHSSKTYLGTFLKAFPFVYEKNIDFENSEFVNFAKEKATPVDRQKFLNIVLPLLKSPDEFKILFNLFEVCDMDVMLIYAFKAHTVSSYYVLFHLLKMREESALIEKYIMLLVKKGDSLAFNMASILKCYFGLVENEEMTFSLKLEPYKLNRLDASFDFFCKIIIGK